MCSTWSALFTGLLSHCLWRLGYGIVLSCLLAHVHARVCPSLAGAFSATVLAPPQLVIGRRVGPPLAI